MLGPSQRSPVASSIARAVPGASGMATTLPPLRVMVSGSGGDTDSHGWPEGIVLAERVGTASAMRTRAIARRLPVA